MKSRIVVISCLALCVFGCVTRFCQSTGGMEISQNEGGQPHLLVDDPCFGEWLRVESAIAKRAPSGMLMAQVTLRNVKKDIEDDNREDDFSAQYEICWFDENGFAVQPDDAIWRTLTWQGGEALPIKETAPMMQATRYVLRLRHVR